MLSESSTGRTAMQARKHMRNNRTGGVLIEYALIAAFAVAAVSAMTTYISRSVASVQNNIDKVAGNY